MCSDIWVRVGVLELAAVEVDNGAMDMMRILVFGRDMRDRTPMVRIERDAIAPIKPGKPATDTSFNNMSATPSGRFRPIPCGDTRLANGNTSP